MVEGARKHGMAAEFLLTPEAAGEWLARETRAGDVVHASTAMPRKLPFPAAIAYVTPSEIEFATAVSSEVEAPPPRLMFATAGSPEP